MAFMQAITAEVVGDHKKTAAANSVSAADQMDPAGAPVIRQALHAMKRNIKIAAEFPDLIPPGSFTIQSDVGGSLIRQLIHRREVAKRLLATAREPQADGVIKDLSDLFEYDQEQLRQLLGLITED